MTVLVEKPGLDFGTGFCTSGDISAIAKISVIGLGQILVIGYQLHLTDMPSLVYTVIK